MHWLPHAGTSERTMCAAGNAKQPAAKELERQRTSFFQSLKRPSKSLSQTTPAPATPTSPASPSAQQPQQPAPAQNAVTHEKQSPPLSTELPGPAPSSSDIVPGATATANGRENTSDASSGASSSKGAAEGDMLESPPQQLQTQSNGTVNGKTSDAVNGHKSSSWDANDPQLKVSAEEEAFLRSLGWTEPGDDEDGGPALSLAWQGIQLYS